MPRPRKLEEEARKQAWATTHPDSMPVIKAKAKKSKSGMPKIPKEVTAGLLMEIAVLILGHLHMEPIAIWGLFILGLLLISDWVIRSWAPSHPKKSTHLKRMLLGMVPVVVGAAVIASFIYKGMTPAVRGLNRGIIGARKSTTITNSKVDGFDVGIDVSNSEKAKIDKTVVIAPKNAKPTKEKPKD